MTQLTNARPRAVQEVGNVAQLEKIGEMPKEGTETLLALLQSRTNGEAAQRLSIAESTLYFRINKFGLDKIIADFPKQALMRLQLGSTRAADKLVEKLDDRREGLQAATEILDRVGLTGDKPSMIQQINVGNEMGVKVSTYDSSGITPDSKTSI